MKHLLCQFAIAIVGVLPVLAETNDVPEYYRALSHQPPPLPASAWTPGDVELPNAADYPGGFRRGVVGISVNPRPDWHWDGEVAEEIRLFLAPGEFRNVWIPVQALEPLKEVALAPTGALQNANGDSLAIENFLFQRNYPALERTSWNDLNCFQVADSPWSIQRGETLWVLATLHAPAQTPPGLYRGTFQITSEKGVQPLPVSLRVLNRPVPPVSVPLGAFVPGHYFRESAGIFTNYAPAWQTPENLEKWVRLWQSRGLNSPFLYHLYIEAELKNGAITVESAFLDDLIRLMIAYKISGPLLLDMRHLSWWSHKVALELAAKGLALEDATLEVAGQDGVFIGQSGATAYPELAKEVFRLAMTAFDRKYGNGAIPVLYLSEEEIGYHDINGFFNPKTVGYETFNPVLLEVAGRDRVCLVDNSQGYGYAGIDRGARDGLRFRAYNNWTPESLAAAEKDHAEVWLYNGGWSRTVAGYLMRLNAQAFHQWADGWWDPAYGFWLVTAVNPDGALSSLQLERTLEGIRDWSYYRLLDQYDTPKLRELRHQWFDRLPCNAPEYQKSFALTDDAELDRRRWACVLAVSEAQKALGEVPLWTPGETGQAPIVWSASAHPVATPDRQGLELTALEAITPVKLDGAGDDPAWRSVPYATTARWTAQEESRLRALASSQEEFERLAPPSSASVQVVYDEKGLYFHAGANHTSPENARESDDSAEIWSDDVLEFFWQEAPSRPEWHLIVNSRGDRTFYRNGQIVPRNAVQVATRHPLNATGGIAQEIFIPWQAMERTGKPEFGALWQFNLCRNFNSWGQLSSWAQVESVFGAANGKLLFGAPFAAGELDVQVAPQELGVGKNALELAWKGIHTVQAQLFAPDGTLLHEQSFAPGERITFHTVISSAAEAGHWLLSLRENDREVARLPLWYAGQTRPIIESFPESVVAGMPLKFRLDIRSGNAELQAASVVLAIHGQNGLPSGEVPLKLHFGRNDLSVSTDGFPAGHYRLEIAGAQRDFSVLDGPFQR